MTNETEPPLETLEAAHEWLLRKSPAEWIAAANEEVSSARSALSGRNMRGAVVALRRASGMALNAALILEPNRHWGRTYMEHLQAIADPNTPTSPSHTPVPDVVRAAAARVLHAQPPEPTLITLRSPSQEHELVEAARDVIAHAYAVVVRHGRMP
jgi:HEPN domain-containing protein